MSHTEKLYLAASGMLCPLGDSPEKTAAALKAGISAYRSSEYENSQGEFITMAGVPEGIFSNFAYEIDQGLEWCECYDRIIKMAILAASQVFQRHPVSTPVPMVLSLAENRPYFPNISPEVMLDNLIDLAKLPIDRQLVRTVHTGRAAVLQSLDLAWRILYDLKQDYVLVGASDSYWDDSALALLDEAGRVLAPNVKNAFVPGEGACFFLLTRHPEKAQVHNGHVIALNPAGIAKEPGHLHSEVNYLGEGLHQAFLQALQAYEGEGIHSIYSSMNGEHYWAKEYGVAMTRNESSFRPERLHHHPADSYGDLGAATGAALIALAAEDLRHITGPATHLVSASSDSAWRAALRIEKLPLNLTNNPGANPAQEAS